MIDRGSSPSASTLFGPYRLESLLGRGGMGEVYRAYDTVKDRVVAVKLLPARLASDTVYQARFRRESRVVARLREPHIIPIHDFGEIDGQLFIDMRMVDGVDLSSLVRREGPLDPARAVHIVGQIGAALDAAHAEDLIHRDVKSSNVIVAGAGADEFAYLIDFGIAHSSLDTNTNGAMLGSPAYTAPERLQPAQAGDVPMRAIDIYALGCVLHELLTGQVPFPRENNWAMMFAHLQTPPPRPSAIRPNLPPGLDDVVTRALAKDPRDRYPSAGALATAARTALTTPRQLSSTNAFPAHVVSESPRLDVSAPQPQRAQSPVDQPRHPTGTQRLFRRWRRWAIPTFALLAVIVLAVILYPLLQSSESPASTAPTETDAAQEAVKAFDAPPGTCLTWPEDQPENMRRVSCDEPHMFEVTNKVEIGSEYGGEARPPAQQKWEQIVTERCTGEAAKYLAGGILDPFGKYTAGALKPTAEQWTDGDRQLRCGLQRTSPSGERLLPTTGAANTQDQSNVHDPGTCFALVDGQVGDPVACEKAHAYEVVGAVDLSEDFDSKGYLSKTAQRDKLVDLCWQVAKKYTGNTDLGKENLSLYSDLLEPESWTAGSRRVNCKVGAVDRNGVPSPTYGSVRG
jgi:serine/threonine protein kinase